MCIRDRELSRPFGAGGMQIRRDCTAQSLRRTGTGLRRPLRAAAVPAVRTAVVYGTDTRRPVCRRRPDRSGEAAPGSCMNARVRFAQETRGLRWSRAHSSLRGADGLASALPSGLLVGRTPEGQALKGRLSPTHRDRRARCRVAQGWRQAETSLLPTPVIVARDGRRSGRCVTVDAGNRRIHRLSRPFRARPMGGP